MFKAALHHLLKNTHLFWNTYVFWKTCISWREWDMPWNLSCSYKEPRVQASLAMEPPHTWFFGIMLRAFLGQGLTPAVLVFGIQSLGAQQEFDPPQLSASHDTGQPCSRFVPAEPQGSSIPWTQQNPGCTTQDVPVVPGAFPGAFCPFLVTRIDTLRRLS